VRQIFAGSVSQFGNLYTVMIRLVDIETGKIVNSQTMDFSGGKEKMITEGMRNLARYFTTGKTAAPATLQATRATESIVDKQSSVEFILIPGGTFYMGNTFPGGFDNEKPVHQVTVSDFYLGRTEVTVAQYRRYCRATNAAMPKEPPWGWQEDEPIVNVSWEDASGFCSWAGGRLPTEAEWEYAARSGGQEEQWAGTSNETEVDDYIWYGQNSNQKANSVAAKRPNGLGLYDMSGNVWEWCADCYAVYSSEPQIDPTGPLKETNFRIWRSGSYLAGVIYTRCTRRASSPSDQKIEWLGFRVARSVQ
jgi:sulfatase modifying factor 1